MFASLIEAALRTTGADELTEYFLYVLILVFFLSIWWKRNDQHSAFTSYAPTLLTSIGILGTFTGIIYGLLDFNTEDIDKSIGPLLAGLKTAFITSLVGMLLSIVYKAVVATGFIKRADAEALSEDEIGAAELYQVMKQQADGIEKLKKAISDNDESSLTGQLKLLRSDLSDNNKKIDAKIVQIWQVSTKQYELMEQQVARFQDFQERLWVEFQNFADMLSKSATEQVIEALKQVIQDFNNNLIEQFGDNFKQLNEAVYRLLEWQDNYKAQLSDMKNQYELGVLAITETESSVAQISEDAKSIPVTMNKLKEVVEINQHQINELDRHLEAFKNIRDRAVMAVPEIRAQIDQAIEGATAANEVLARGMQDSADRMGEVLLEGSEHFKDNVNQTSAALIEASQTTASSSEQIREQFATALEDINSNMRDLISQLQQGGQELTESHQTASKVLIEESQQTSQAFTTAIGDMRARMEQTISEHTSEHKRQADRVFAGLEKTIEETLSNTGESVQKQVDMIDKTTSEEIQKVMNSMGNALASISGQFTTDYRRLVDQMSKVVNQQP